MRKKAITKNELKALYKELKSAGRVARKLKLSSEDLKKLSEKLGVKQPPKKINFTKKFLSYLYIEKKYTAKEICDMYNFKMEVLTAKLKSYKLTNIKYKRTKEPIPRKKRKNIIEIKDSNIIENFAVPRLDDIEKTIEQKHLSPCDLGIHDKENISITDINKFIEGKCKICGKDLINKNGIWIIKKVKQKIEFTDKEVFDLLFKKI